MYRRSKQFPDIVERPPVSRGRVLLPRNRFVDAIPRPYRALFLRPTSYWTDPHRVRTCVDGWFRLRADFIAAAIVFRARYDLLRASSSWSPWTWPRFVGNWRYGEEEVG